MMNEEEKRKAIEFMLSCPGETAPFPWTAGARAGIGDEKELMDLWYENLIREKGWGTIADLTPDPVPKPEEVLVGYISADCPNCDRTRLELFVRKDSRRFHSIVCEKCGQKVLAGDFKW